MADFTDPVFLARLQFVFTVSFHVIFPATLIGLASFLAFVQWRWLLGTVIKSIRSRSGEPASSSQLRSRP